MGDAMKLNGVSIDIVSNGYVLDITNTEEKESDDDYSKRYITNRVLYTNVNKMLKDLKGLLKQEQSN